MPKVVVANVPPGPFQDEMAQLFKKYEVHYRISEDTGKLTDFLRYLQECANLYSSECLNYNFLGNFSSEMIGGSQYLVSGRDNRFQSESSGKEPFGPQETSYHLAEPDLGTSSANFHYSIVREEPLDLNSTDILLGTAPGRSSIMSSPGNKPLDSFAEEQEVEANSLFMQDVPPLLQLIHPLLSGLEDAQVVTEAEGDERHETGAVECLVKEEDRMNTLGDSGDFDEEAGVKKAEETNQECSVLDNKAHCDVCGALFSSERSAKRHKRTHNEERPAFECETCQKRFSRNSGLKNHLRLHTGEKPFECKPCERRFTSSSALAKHRRYRCNQKPL